MKSFRKWFLVLATSILIVTSIISVVPKKAEAADDFLGVRAKAAILIDAKSGKILYQKNSDAVLGVASMTKMMTEYLLLEAIKEGKVKWDQKYGVSDYVYEVSQDYPALSNVPLRKDGKYTIRELYEAMTIYSANGATIAIAETIAGSEANFVKMMSKKATELGMENFEFFNSTGLNNKDLHGYHHTGTIESENVMSAKATAKLAFHLINDYPEILETASTPKKKFREGTDDVIQMENWNWMLPSLVFSYEGVDGLKTGTTEFAGLCFTGTAERKGNRYITVIMDAVDENGNNSEKKIRFDETKKMLNYAFTNFSEEKVLDKNYQVKGKKSLPVIKGKGDKVKIHTKDSISLVLKSGEEENYKPVLVLDKKKLTKDGELTAPVKKGEKIGYVTLEAKNGTDLGFITDKGNSSIKVDVVAAETVEKANGFVLMMRGIGSFFGDIWGSISSAVKSWF